MSEDWVQLFDNISVYANGYQLRITKDASVLSRPAKFFLGNTEDIADNTELYIKRNKKNIVITLGESWTYGDSLTNVKVLHRKDDPLHRANSTFGAHCARILNADLFISAVPGNSNGNIFKTLEPTLNYVNTLGYENIYLIYQFTSPGRDIADNWFRDTFKDANLLYQFKDKGSSKLSTLEWFKAYDTMMYKHLDELLTKYTNVKALAWKNFNKILTDYKPNNYTIIKTSWLEYLNYLSNRETEIVHCNESYWWKDTYFELKIINHDVAFATQQMEDWAKASGFLGNSGLSGYHPNELSHFMWAVYLLREANWSHV